MPLAEGMRLALPDAAARHVQVLRLQPGDPLVLFGEGSAAAAAAPAGEFVATIEQIGRRSVQVRVERWRAADREPARAVHLAIGMPANERMDWLVEKATELGVASIQPLASERTVVRLDAPRAAKRVQHWSAIAVSACEQCGRNRVPPVHGPASLGDWLGRLQPDPLQVRWMLSFRADAVPVRERAAGLSLAGGANVQVLCGPEGGLSDQEEAAALDRGFVPVSLGPRILRAETAALAALTLLT